jgi:hypothetical protein
MDQYDEEKTDREMLAKATGPVILHEGRYRLYKKPDGGMRLQYQRDDKTEEDFIELPAMFVRLADAAAKGEMKPADMVKAMISMRP